ncbi:MAG: tyrosine-type recombinase/integrase [Burkholderiales bacterium]
MPKRAHEWKAVAVSRCRVRGLHAVGGAPGLCLQVSPAGGRSWVLRVRMGGRRRDLGLGGYPAVTLAEARVEARRLRERIRQGIDPVAERTAARASLAAVRARALTFMAAARRCHQAKAQEFRNAKHAREWLATLDRYAFPVIGGLDVAVIDLTHVLNVLQPIWSTKTETATRVRQRIEAVLTWATVSGHRHGENPARWRGHLDALLPKPRKLKRVQHHRALPWQEIGAFMRRLRVCEGLAARALDFVILTAARSGEVRGARWEEMDLDARLWTVPAERIKAGRTHLVPLSRDAVALLRALPQLADVPYVFPSTRGTPLSDMALLQVCRRLAVDAVPHGFRSTFKDYARSCTLFLDEVSELALAHVNSDATRAAYARDELLPQRRKLMDAWAKFCAIEGAAGKVLTLAGRRGQ